MLFVKDGANAVQLSTMRRGLAAIDVSVRNARSKAGSGVDSFPVSSLKCIGRRLGANRAKSRDKGRSRAKLD